MLKEFKPQFKSPTPSVYQQFEIPIYKSNSYTSRHRWLKNTLQKRSRESRYTFCTFARSRFFDRRSLHNHSSTSDRNGSRYDQNNNLLRVNITLLCRIMTLSCLIVIIENTLVLVNALPVTIIPPLYDTNHRIDHLLTMY